MSYRRRLGAALCGIAIAVAALGGEAVAEVPDRKVLKSRLADQSIGNVQLQKAGARRVRVDFAVRYPRVGEAGEDSTVRLTVFSTARRGTETKRIEREVQRARGEAASHTVKFGGRAARELLSSGLRRKSTRRKLIITHYDARDLGAGKAVDHINGVTSTARAAESKPGPVDSTPSLGGDITDITINNQSPNPIILSAAPLGCIYDNGAGGNGGSHLTAFDRVQLGSGVEISHHVQNDANLFHDIGENFSMDAPAPVTGGSTVITPEYADGRYNHSVKGLMFEAVNRYMAPQAGNLTNPNPVVYESAVEKLYPGTGAGGCHEVQPAKFVIGADRFVAPVPNGGVPGQARTDLSGAALFEIPESNSVQSVAALDNTGLSLTRTNPHAIVVFDQGEPACSKTGGPLWMTCRLPDDPFGDLKLSDLVLPGTHDSATPGVSALRDWLLTEASACTNYSSIFSLDASIVHDLAYTQTLMMLDQLEAGIRYLDLRAAYDPGYDSGVPDFSDPGQMWRFVHSMFALSSLRSEVQDIANWAAAHPDEILVLDFNHICANSSASPTTDEQMQDLVEDLSAPDPVTGLSLCDVAYQLPAEMDRVDVPATTLQQMRDPGPGRVGNVLVLFGKGAPEGAGVCGYPVQDVTGNNSAGNPGDVPLNHLWPEEQGPGKCGDPSLNNEPTGNIIGFPYGQPDTNDTRKHIGYAPHLDVFRSLRPTPLMQTQTQYTVSDTGKIEKEILDCGSLEAYESDFVNGGFREQVLSAWGEDANIVIGDFVDRGSYIADLIAYGPG